MMMTTIIVTVTMTTIMIMRMMLCHYDGDDGNGDSDGTIILAGVDLLFWRPGGWNWSSRCFCCQGFQRSLLNTKNNRDFPEENRSDCLQEEARVFLTRGGQKGSKIKINCSTLFQSQKFGNNNPIHHHLDGMGLNLWTHPCYGRRSAVLINCPLKCRWRWMIAWADQGACYSGISWWPVLVSFSLAGLYAVKGSTRHTAAGPWCTWGPNKVLAGGWYEGLNGSGGLLFIQAWMLCRTFCHTRTKSEF